MFVVYIDSIYTIWESQFGIDRNITNFSLFISSITEKVRISGILYLLLLLVVQITK